MDFFIKMICDIEVKRWAAIGSPGMGLVLLKSGDGKYERQVG